MDRFTTRDVLWLTVVIAVLGAWFIDRSAQAWTLHVSESKLRLDVGKLNELGWTLKAHANGREFEVSRLYRPKPQS